MMNLRTIMVSDANAANTKEEHDASLTAFYCVFGDVMDTDTIIESLGRAGRLPSSSDLRARLGQ
jgi:ureidoacrylate peracid hydrolase